MYFCENINVNNVTFFGVYSKKGAKYIQILYDDECDTATICQLLKDISGGWSMGILFYALISFISYMVLTAGSGNLFMLWSPEEVIAGICISLFMGILCHKIIPRPVNMQAFNPFRWILVILYVVGPFFLMMLVANVEVIYRVLTGKINPAIVRVKTGLKSETGAYILSNSITLSPGTLTIELEPGTHDLYIHCLNWKKEKGEEAEPADVSGVLHFFIKKIFG